MPISEDAVEVYLRCDEYSRSTSVLELTIAGKLGDGQESGDDMNEIAKVGFGCEGWLGFGRGVAGEKVRLRWDKTVADGGRKVDLDASFFFDPRALRTELEKMGIKLGLDLRKFCDRCVKLRSEYEGTRSRVVALLSVGAV